MKRRGERVRPPIPEEWLRREARGECAVPPEWAEENGWDVFDINDAIVTFRLGLQGGDAA